MPAWLRDWSLIMGRGGGVKTGGGGKRFSHPEGGGIKGFRVVFVW